MEIADKVVGWIVTLGPLCGALWLYIQQRREKRKKERGGTAAIAPDTEVIQGTPVAVVPTDFAAVLIATLREDAEEWEARYEKQAKELRKAQLALIKNGIPLP